MQLTGRRGCGWTTQKVLYCKDFRLQVLLCIELAARSAVVVPQNAVGVWSLPGFCCYERGRCLEGFVA